MMKKLKYIMFTCVSLLSFSVLAQMSTASLFPGMKSSNPAVIGMRKSGQMTAVGKISKIKKEQTLSTANGFIFDGTDNQEIDITTANFFRGGKGGGFLTSEMTLDYSMGTKKETMTSGTESTEDSNDVSAMYFNYAAALGKTFGLAATYFKYDYDQVSSFTFAGQTEDTNSKIEVEIKALRGGLHTTFIGLDVGLYIEHMILENSVSVGGAGAASATGTGTNSQGLQNVGLSLGLSSSAFHMEAGVERALQATTMEGKTYNPMRLSFVTEFKLGKLSLGYTGRYYLDGYFDIETTVVDQIVYRSSRTEPRLENNFNFAIGSTKGLSFSGSVSYSKSEVKEENNIFSVPGVKNPTTITALGATVQVGYVF